MDDRGPRLVTRCAHCDTAFRVYEHQLTKREGQVRCGACGGIFNAYDSLEDEVSDPLRIDGPPSLMPRDTDVPVGSPVSAREVDLPLEAGEDHPAGRRRNARDDRDGRGGRSDSDHPDSPLGASAAADTALADELVSDSYLTEDGGDYDFGPRAPSRSRRIAAALGVTGLAILFVVQTLFWFRHELAGRLPVIAPALQALCEPIGCDVRLPQRATELVIETSELQTEPSGLLKLTATIRNNAPYMQMQPMLELTLTDPREQPVVRKVLAPSDYLEPAAAAAGSLPAKGDVVARVYVDARAAEASGYRLLVFYP